MRPLRSQHALDSGVTVGPFDAVTLVLALTFDVALALPGI